MSGLLNELEERAMMSIALQVEGRYSNAETLLTSHPHVLEKLWSAARLGMYLAAASGKMASRMFVCVSEPVRTHKFAFQSNKPSVKLPSPFSPWSLSVEVSNFRCGSIFSSKLALATEDDERDFIDYASELLVAKGREEGLDAVVDHFGERISILFQWGSFIGEDQKDSFEQLVKDGSVMSAADAKERFSFPVN